MRPSKREIAVRAAGLALVLGAALVAIPWLRVMLDDDAPSTSTGRLSAGRLVHGHVMPPWGRGHITYSFMGAALGRQYMHGAVLATLADAFAARAEAVPGQRHVLGETAVRGGGAFHGHRTHQNGLSVDVFMPVRNGADRRVILPTWPWNGFGYWWEFDEHGNAGGYRIDFDELGAFLVELDRRARVHGLDIVRVIIAPEYVPLLLRGAAGPRLGHIAAKLTRRAVWVRHDEHVHIDFATTDEPRAPDAAGDSD